MADQLDASCSQTCPLDISALLKGWTDLISQILHEDTHHQKCSKHSARQWAVMHPDELPSIDFVEAHCFNAKKDF